jgi:BspA type Leucine rich repeat region (6 copies)/Bacterial TSP3 repeat
MFQNLIPSILTRAIIAAVLFIAAALPSQALQSGDFTYTSTGSAIIITAYTGAGTSPNSIGVAVTIPSSISGLPVTVIGLHAFHNCYGLTSVVIPNSVTSIGQTAFGGCTGLISVSIPNSVTSIGDQAFSGCSGLTSVVIPNSVTSIGNRAFQGCGLTSVTIGSGVISIGDSAFQGCSALTSVVIPNSVTSIGINAFYGTGLTLLQSGDFTYISTGSAIIITAYTGAGTSPNSIGVAVTIPSSISGLPVTVIGPYAFGGCTGLTSVSIPNSVTSIGDSAFYGCSGLTSVAIPNSVTSIGAGAFGGCTGLTSMVVDAANQNYSSMAGVLFNKNQSTLIQYPGGKTGSYTIPNSVTSIGDSAFLACSGLTSVVIPNSVISMGSSAFQFCTGLTSVTIGSGVTSIGYGAFYYCIGLTSVTIPNSVTSIGLNAFLACSGLTSVTIGNGVTSIGQNAFYECGGLTGVTIPNSVTSMGSSAFQGCTGLTSVTIGSGVTSIGEEAFGGCRSLASIHFQGNAPTTTEFWAVRNNVTPATVYYRADTTGWGSTFAGLRTVQVLAVATITSQPVSVTSLQATGATFAVTAIGATGYQWQKNGVNIPRARNATLILSNVQQADATNYTVVISNLFGDVISNTASLTVMPDSDLDGLSDAAEATLGTNPNNSDSDEDGLNDRAEIQVYLSNPLLKDSDADGFEDGFEVSTGFNPAQASSSPDSVSTIGNAVGFRFNAGLGLSYRIEDSTDLQNWNTLESPIVGAGGVVTRFYFTEGQPKRYFRVKKN